MTEQMTLDVAMRLRIESDAVTDALRLVLPFATGGIPVYAGVKITARDDQLVFEATNGDERVVTTLSAHVDQPGQAIVPAAVLNAFLKSVSGAVNIEQNDSVMNIACGSSSLELHTMTHADWPLFAEIDEPEYEITPEMWVGMRRTMHAQGGTEDKTANRHCVHFETGAIMAQNGRRVALFDLPEFKANVTSNIPGGFLGTIAKLVDPKQSVFVRFAERLASFRSGPTEWMCRPLVDSYPNVRAIFDTPAPFDLIMVRNDLAKALARTGVLPEQSAWKQVTMERVEDELILTATGPDVGKTTDVIACSGSYVGAPLIMNIPELKHLIDNSVEDELRFSVADAFKAIRLIEGPWRAALMPRRPPDAPPATPPPAPDANAAPDTSN